MLIISLLWIMGGALLYDRLNNNDPNDPEPFDLYNWLFVILLWPLFAGIILTSILLDKLESLGARR